MGRLRTALNNGDFVITAEIAPPKGTNPAALFDSEKWLRGQVTAVNVTDSHAARMAMSPLAASVLLIQKGIEPIMQLTTRDRNRIALQADLLGGWALGIRNVSFMGGDPPTNGDHPNAKGVFDLYASQLIATARGLAENHDHSGNALDGGAEYTIGAVVNPGAANPDSEIERMEQKREAGAMFFQTQAIYDPVAFDAFIDRIHNRDAKILAGIIPVKSERMARYMNKHVPGIDVPEILIREIAESKDPVATSIAQCRRILQQIRPLCDGVHIMAIGWERYIPDILTDYREPRKTSTGWGVGGGSTVTPDVSH